MGGASGHGKSPATNCMVALPNRETGYHFRWERSRADKPLVCRVRAVNGTESSKIDMRGWRSPDAAMAKTDQDILAQLGFPTARLLGSGSEATVYALPKARVLRLMKPGARLADAEARAHLLAKISAGGSHLPFVTPHVQSIERIDERIAVIEPLLPGTPASETLTKQAGEQRRLLICNYLNAAETIADITLTAEYFGPLMGETALRAPSWSLFLRKRLEQGLQSCPADLRAAVSAAMAVELPEPERASLVHLDYFPANVLADQTAITAVLDFGASSIMGDRRMEAWSAVAYLDPELSPTANENDRITARTWLAERDLMTDYPRAKRWLAAYWSFAADDASLMAWCRRVLA